MTDQAIFSPVLVYISDQRGLDLAAEILRTGGFEANRARNLSELELALERLECAVIVTVTAKIGEVRALCNLPIVNIQAFVLPNVERAENQPQSIFDRGGFLDRVRLNHRDRPVTMRHTPRRFVS
jgi:hypothetical protein